MEERAQSQIVEYLHGNQLLQRLHRLLILAILGFLPLVDHVLVFKNLNSIFSILTLCYLFGFRQKGQAKAKRECLNLMEMVRMYPFRISQLINSLNNPLNC
jgi:hypothetical protein